MKKYILLFLLTFLFFLLLIIYVNEKRTVYQIIKYENNEPQVYETYKYFVDTDYIEFTDISTGKKMKIEPPYRLMKK